MKFSVIVPIWNAEKTIESCLESILGQTSVPDEIVVIDGGSTDATLSLVKKHLRPQDTVITEPDKGPYDAMNKGVAIAQGEIVAILNSDDYWMPETCETVRGVFASSSDKTGIVHGDVKYLKKDGDSDRLRPAHGVWNYFCIGVPTNHPATFVRKKVYDAIGCYDFERYPICADQDFVYRAMGYGYRLKYLENILSHMRGGGLSSYTSCSAEIDRMLGRLAQPRRFCAKTLRLWLRHQDSYYCGGFKRVWYKEIACAILTLGGAPQRFISSLTMKLALRTRTKKVKKAIASIFK